MHRSQPEATSRGVDEHAFSGLQSREPIQPIERSHIYHGKGCGLGQAHTIGHAENMRSLDGNKLTKGSRSEGEYAVAGGKSASTTRLHHGARALASQLPNRAGQHPERGHNIAEIDTVRGDRNLHL